MAQLLTVIPWIEEDPDAIDQFTKTEVDGQTFYVAGCEAFTEDQLGAGSEQDRLRARIGIKAATRNSRPRWSKGLVPFRLVSNFTEQEKVLFLQAADMWMTAAGRNSDGSATLGFFEDTAKRFSPYLRVMKGGSNNEASNGAVSSAYLKIAIFDVGSIAHELGHVLGLVHEHQRSDRDNYVSVMPAVSGNLNFRRHGKDEDTIRTGYDFSSIMHYGRQVVLNGAPVDALVPKAKHQAAAARMGQRTAPSELDVMAIRSVYAK